LDLKKIANMNPNKNASAVINKRENVQKIASMFKGIAKL